MDALNNIMAIIDKNQNNISDGDYLDICNNLKDLYQRPSSGEWDDIMDTYKAWKEQVRLAMEAETRMKRVNTLYKEHTRNNSTVLMQVCLDHHMKKHNLHEATDADVQYVHENLELVCQDIVNDSYEDAYRTYKYQADEEWEKLTRHPQFETLMNLMSPVELYMHRALCVPQGENLSCVYRQKETRIVHDGHYIQQEFTWFSHERDHPELDECDPMEYD